VKGENLSLTYYSFASSKLQVIGDVSPGPNLPIVVTLGGIGSFYASLTYKLQAFVLPTNCAIIMCTWSNEEYD
jgi:hypothetical protein